MTQLFHITSLHSAISIIRTGRFHPASQNPLCADAGVNSFIVGRQANLDQCFEGVGARLIFDWNGPIKRPGNFPLRPDVLYVYGAWRAFIPVGSQRFLNVVGLDCQPDEWRDLEINAPWGCDLPGVSRWWKSKHGAKVRQEVEGLIGHRPSVKVGNLAT